MYKHILIPTDGSELAEKGLDHGLLLAKTLGAAATVIVVTVPLSGFALQGMTEAAALGAYDNSVADELVILKRNIADKAARGGIAFDLSMSSMARQHLQSLKLRLKRNAISSSSRLMGAGALPGC